ncbi:MAG: sigma 54-interacting transcriptional regulator [Chthoniobacter sp.]
MDHIDFLLVVPNPTGGGDISIVPLKLGLQEKMGWLVAGSGRADFPTEMERLLLSVAANQVAIGLQEAQLLSAQRRVAEELDREVGYRTEQLIAANRELTKLRDQLRRENIVLREEVDAASMFEEIVGASTALTTVLSRVSKVAPTGATVLITGETGTGKELIARAIHKRSARSDRAFVSVNCAAIRCHPAVLDRLGIVRP